MKNTEKHSTNTVTVPQKKVRLRTGERPDVGNDRYQLLRSAADRTRAAMNAGYYLEATTLLESLLAERLEKRAQWLYDHQPTQDTIDALKNVKDGFKTLHLLIAALKKAETDENIRSLLELIDAWRRSRNDAIHEMAKFGHGADKSWDERYLATHEAAVEGVRLVLKLDLHERRVCHAARNKTHASATCPDALASLGQPRCEWCK